MPAVADRPLPAVHLRPRYLALVALGGAVGTAAREALSLAVPDLGRFPLAVFAINLGGAFVLGTLLEVLLRLGQDTGARRLVRLGAGTGFCGGFTTYSSLATATAVLLADGAPPLGLLYAAATLVLGGAATWAGVAVGAAAHPGRTS